MQFQRSVRLGYAEGERRIVRRPFEAAEYFAFSAFAALVSFSAIVVCTGAWEEPYFGPIRIGQGLMQVGVGAALLLSWLEWAVVLVVLWFNGKLRLWLLIPLLCAGLVCALYTAQCPIGYLNDLARFQQSGQR